MKNYAKLNPVKLALAVGIISAIVVGLSVMMAVLGWFSAYSALCMAWLIAIYGFIGFDVNWLGVLLGMIYSFADIFVFTFIVAWLYNKLL